MGALFGFLGEPDPALPGRMAGMLAHRGRNPVFGRTAHGSIGYAAKANGLAPHHRGAGLAVDGDLALAVAGFIDVPSVEALLAAYRQRGAGVLESLRGAFVLALLDGRELYLVRDGAGARSLYYARHAGRLCFAVEPKALWSQPGFSRRLRPAALAQYFSFSFVPGAGTMLEGIQELMPGHLIHCREGEEPVQRRYFLFEHDDERERAQKLAAGDAGAADDTFWTAAFRERLGAAVSERLPATEPVGAFLSGGIDSSVVVCELARRAPGRVHTFAIHFGKKYPNELAYARAVADRLGTHHREVEIRPKHFLPKLRRIIWHLDDPIGDPVTMPNFELAGVVAREMPAVFNGEGGDPCFGGPKNIPMMMHHWYGPGTEPAPNLAQAYLASYRRAYGALPKLLAPDMLARIDPVRDLENLLTPMLEGPGPERLLHRLLSLNIRYKGGHLILPKVERMLGAWGVTPLSPLFDERLVRFAFAMPPRFVLHRGIEKVILKRAYANELPVEVIERPKCGMRVPVHFWFQKDLRRYAKSILSRKNVSRAGIFDPDQVAALLNYDWETAGGRYGIRLWMLLTFEIWRRIVIEAEPL